MAFFWVWCWSQTRLKKTNQIDDIGVQTDRPNRRYSIINWTLIPVNIFHLVGFLKPWFLTNITSPGAKKTQGFARCLANKVEKTSPFQVPSPFFATQTYLFSVTHKRPPTAYLLRPTYHHLSLPPPTCHYLYLPLPTTTCHYPPATTCHILPLPYLPISSTLYLPLPASLYLPLHYLPLPATTSTCQYLTLPAIACHYLLLLDYQLLRLIDMCYSIVKMWKHSKYQSSRALAYQTRVPNSPENNIFYVVLAADNTPTGQIEDQIK